jgi:hypothetical protein
LVQGLPPRTAGQERGSEVQPPRLLTGSSTRILKYSEELKLEPNTEIGPKDFFEVAYSKNMLMETTKSVRKQKINGLACGCWRQII